MEKKFIFYVLKDGKKLYRAKDLNDIEDYSLESFCFWTEDYKKACHLREYEVQFFVKNALNTNLSFHVDFIESVENE